MCPKAQGTGDPHKWRAVTLEGSTLIGCIVCGQTLVYWSGR